jgi:hypothetical protein
MVELSLQRPNAVQQLYFYTKRLCVPVPFASARESLLTLFDLLLRSNLSQLSQVGGAERDRVGASFTKHPSKIYFYL